MKKIFFLVSFLFFGLGFGQNQTIFKDVNFQPPKISFTDYNPSGSVSPCEAYDIKRQNDGKIIVGGLFNNLNGNPVSHLVRLNEDGSLDTIFDLSSSDFNPVSVYKVFIQSDNKILVLCRGFTNCYINKLIRFMPDGSVDSSYNIPVLSSWSCYYGVPIVEMQSDEKIIIGLTDLKINGIQTNSPLVRLNNDGTIDNSFASPLTNCNTTDYASDIKIDSTGKIIVVGNMSTLSCVFKKIIRLNTNGTEDTTFTPPTEIVNGDVQVNKIAVLSDNKIMISVYFNVSSGTSVFKVIRLNVNGSYDNSFTDLVIQYGFDLHMFVQPDNKLLVLVSTNSFIGGNPVKTIFRVNTDGTIDSTFDFNVNSNFSGQHSRNLTLLIKPNGNIIVGGDYISSNSSLINGLIEVNSNGIYNSSFSIGTGLRGNGYISKIKQLTDGKILIAGAFDYVNGITRRGFARLNSDGSLDTSFDNGGVGVGINSNVRTFAIQDDGKIVIGGQFGTYDDEIKRGVIRLNSDGTIDTTFAACTNLSVSTDGVPIIESIVIQNDGKIIIGGAFDVYNVSRKNITRLNSNGTIDYTFNAGNGFNKKVIKLELQPDQKILVSGSFTTYNNVAVSSQFLRLNPDGLIDTTFNPVGYYNNISGGEKFSLLPNGKIYAINNTSSNFPNQKLERLNSDGSVDLSPVFDLTNTRILDFCVQPDNKLLVASSSYNNTLKNISRFNEDGSLDTSFNIGLGLSKSSFDDFTYGDNGSTNFEIRGSANAKSLFLQDDGKLLVGGYFTHFNGFPAVGTLRLLNINSFNLKGQNRLDQNNNGCDASDFSFRNLKFQVSNGSNNFNYIASNIGNYNISFVEGNYTITPTFENPSYFTASPSSVSVSFPSQASPVIQDFCITPNGLHPDLEVTLLPLTVARPGFETKYRLVYKNKGNQLQSGTVNFNFNDAVLNFVTATTAVSSQTLNNLNWNFTNLMPLETREITITLNVNSPTATPPVISGFVLNYTTSVSSTLTDEMTSDNTFTFNQTVVNSFDPNDKTCLEGASIATTKVGDYVHYMIRFENTGSYNAQNITVKDVIDTTKYDINTLLPTSGSHSFITRILEGNRAEFYFENINLPFADATNDGYVAFKIKTKSTLVAGDSFSNSAGIYFDYNYPITTNTATTTITALSSQDFTFNNYFSIYPNPVENNLNISKKEEIEISSITIYNMLGQIVVAIPNAKNVENVDVSSLKSGNYFVKINTDKGNSNTKFIKL